MLDLASSQGDFRHIKTFNSNGIHTKPLLGHYAPTSTLVLKASIRVPKTMLEDMNVAPYPGKKSNGSGKE